MNNKAGVSILLISIFAPVKYLYTVLIGGLVVMLVSFSPKKEEKKLLDDLYLNI